MSRHRVHPWVFMVLILPFGVIGGYLSVAIGYLLGKSGVPVGQIAAIVALGLLPHTWKFAWAPIADTTLTRKAWYVIGCVASAIGIFLTGAIPATSAGLTALSIVVFTSNFGVTFLGMSVESLMAYDTPEEAKGRAGGWFQAGNLGGYGLGGGAGLWLAQVLPAPWMAGAILAVACLGCCAALFLLDEPRVTLRHESLAASLADVGRDLWALARSRRGSIALILCFLPIGSGAAGGLWSAVASDWKASLATVALATGVLTGIVSAVGCVIGGWICDRADRKAAYAAYGVLQALCAIAMGLAPRNEATFIFFTLLYALITGLTYAGFSAFVLEAMGTGAAATKYSVFASLSNMPIYYMTWIDGRAHDRWGPAGMLFTEAAFGALGLVMFLGVLALYRRRIHPSARTAAAPPPG